MMGHGAWFVAGWVTIVVAGTSTEASAQSQPIDLSRLVADLNLTWGGTAKWLKLLEAQEHGSSVERLVAVTPTGEPLMERDGEASSVSLGSELDLLLRRQGRSVVLIHNHPTGVGLSAADIGHLAKPGLAAIVALGHEGSVFIAAAGPALDGDSLAEQIAIAQAAVRERLRADGASVPARVGQAHSNHLVTQALAEVRVITYWFALSDTGRESYERAHVIFGHAVHAGAARLRRDSQRRRTVKR